MPTNAGPNTYGEENLVFGYDLGDSVNSYKGEPTTNLVDAFPDVSLPSGFYWTYEYSASISDSPISGHFLSNRKWVKLTKTSATNGRVLFNANSFTAGNTYTITAYVYIDDNRNTSLAFNSDNVGYSQETVDTPYNFSKIGTVQRIRGTWNQLQNGGSIYGLRGGTSNPIGSTIYITGLQVEQNAHPTQLTAGTRSATQGLIDLTGNSTINLSNVSFDSNAIMDFDGTNDYVTVGTNTDFYFGTGDFTIEAVFTPTDNGNGWTGVVNKGGSGATGFAMSYYANGNGTMTLYMDIDAPDNTHYSSGVLTSGQTYHIVMVYDRDSAGYVYNNGTLTYTHTGLTGQNQSVDVSRPLRLGCYDNAQWFMDGKIHMVKLYDRALTGLEVSKNYKAIKSRFNI